MSTVVNPILPSTALLRPQMPGVYQRQMIYDPTWNDPSYNSYLGQRLVPAPGSLVKDSDQTPLWVTSIDPVTYIPSYTAVPLSSTNDNVVSMLDYGNTVLRLYTDNRHLPYPVTPDSKCVVIGKSPRFYTLTRYPGTVNETVISEHYDSTGTLVGQMIPMIALDSSHTSWYLPRGHVSVILDHNEEVEVKVFGEDGIEVYSALLFAKESAVINEDVIYAPTIVGMTVSAHQQLTNGTFFLYEKQDFGSLGLSATIVFDDGSTQVVPIDGVKCRLYGDKDFISSFAGLQQTVTIKYFRSPNETISSSISDPTGAMISLDIPVTVIPNAFATTNKILLIPSYNSTLARYIARYWMYFADGRSHIDVTPFISINSGSLHTDSSYFGVQQVYTVGLDMHQVDAVNYPVATTYQQSFAVTFNPPNSLVKWTIRDSVSSPYILGQDISQSRRPSIRFDTTLKQYFIPSMVFGNIAAFVKSFYTQASPPYDPSVAIMPQEPTHFVVRNLLTGNQLVASPISMANYSQAFNILGDVVGNYVNTVVVVEFLKVVNSSTTHVLFGCPVDVSQGSYISA